ncbi:MAG TPA: pyridoxal-dependent decarboxylase, partial [Candidatus Koribacter sp.]
MGFELSREERQRLGYQLIDRINDFYESLPTRNVQLPAESRVFAPLDEPLPEFPAPDAARVLDDLTRDLIDQGFHVPAANYFGLMNPTPAYMAVLAEALVAALNPQLASLARSQLAARIELETVRWVGERVGWSGPFDGTFTSGGNEANFSALALALAKHFPGAIENGVASIGAEPILYTSAEAHHSLDKSAGLLGIGRRAVRRIPITDRIQLDPDLLVKEIDKDRSAGRKPFCVVATAGTTNSGAIDDIPVLAEMCERQNLWLHLDGAYGASAIFSDRHRHLLNGIERCDSFTVDPHKWLAMPFAAGVILTRHPQTLRDAFEVSTPYMPKAVGAAPTDNFKTSTQWSRRMNSLKLYLTLRVHGRQAYEEHIDRQLALAHQAAEWFRNSDLFELAAPVYLPILNFRLR